MALRIERFPRPKRVCLGVDPGTSKGSPLTAVYTRERGVKPFEVFQGHTACTILKKDEEIVSMVPYDRLLPLYSDFRKWLAEVVRIRGDEHLIMVIEEPISVQNGHTTILLAQINLMIQMACCQKAQLGVGNVIMVPVGTWKKIVLGKGNFKKDQVLKEVYKKWGLDFDSNDEADAYCLSDYGFTI